MADQQSAGAGLRELALFAGAGGGILGGKLLGWQTVCAVEWGEYPASVLCARQNEGLLPPFPIWDDVQNFDGRPWRGIVDVVSGGFPCQDISLAGKGAGIDGERSGMWGHMARIIGEVRPRFAFVENSPALLTRGLGTVLSDLAALGYDCRWTVLGAADVGANHQRNRFWLVANARGGRCGEPGEGQDQQPGRTQAVGASYPVADTAGIRVEEWMRQNGESSARKSSKGRAEVGGGGEELADTSDQGLPQPEQIEPRGARRWQEGRAAAERSWWATEPDVDRVVNGLAARVDRLKAIGNGQVPLCAATAWRMLSNQ